MRRTWYSRIFWTIAGVIFIAHAAGGDDSLTDTKKKDIVYAMYADYKKDFPAVIDISPQQAMALLQKNTVVFIDTRKPAEMKVSMLPRAIPQSQFLDHPEEYAGKTVVGYCTISYRSGVFAREMQPKGITVHNLAGGILAWTLEGGKVYAENGAETKRIHVYGRKWNYAPAGYEAVVFSLWEQMF